MVRLPQLALLLAAFLILGCASVQQPKAPEQQNSTVSLPSKPGDAKGDKNQLPNPASLFCIQKGYAHELRGDAGYCIFGDGGECEEWAFYRGECQPKPPSKSGLADVGQICGGESGIKCKEGLECQADVEGGKGVCAKPIVFLDCPAVRGEICAAIYDPVCGRAGKTPSQYEYKTYPNSCVACSKSSPALAYAQGTCESLNLFSLPKKPDVLYACPEKRFSKCGQEDDPVCGRIVDATSSLSYYRDFRNPCEACSERSNAIAYYIGTCESMR